MAKTRNYTPEQREALRQRIQAINEKKRQAKLEKAKQNDLVQSPVQYAVPKGSQVSEGRSETEQRSEANQTNNQGAIPTELGGIRSVVESMVAHVAQESRDSGSVRDSGGNGIHGESSQVCDGQTHSESGTGSGDHPKQQSQPVGYSEADIEHLRQCVRDPVKWGEWLYGQPLDEWQRDAAAAFARGERIARAICNGGGKTRLYAILGTWLLANFKSARVIMTAGSYAQCEIMRDMELRPIMHKLGGWTLKNDELVHQNGDKFLWKSTDNAGLFEGHHADHVGVLIDESKSVNKTIYEASERLTANVKRFCMVASSTGAAIGWFYDCFARNKKFWNAKQISAYQIARIPKAIIEDAESMRASNPDLFKSKILAEFTGAEEGAFIKLENFNKIVEFPCLKQKGIRIAGVDCAGSGADNNVIVIREGNEIIFTKIFKEADTMITAHKIVSEMRNQGVKAENVHFDVSGMGIGIADKMRELNFDPDRVNFGAAPLNRRSDTITNRMSELWNVMRETIEAGNLKFNESISNDFIDALRGEMTSRKIIPQANGKLKLESKEDMRKRGLGSPDCADALALSLIESSKVFSFKIGSIDMSDFRGSHQEAELNRNDLSYSHHGFSLGGNF